MWVCQINYSDLSQMDRVWNSVFLKVLKTYYKDCIADIQISIRQLPNSMDIDTWKKYLIYYKYISKLKLSKNKILAGLFNISGYWQLTKLLSDYNMPDICNIFKGCLLDFLGKNAQFFLFLLYFFLNFSVCCKNVSYV